MDMLSPSSMSRPECPTCGKTFARQAHLERHLETHRATPRWRCPSCTRSYTRRDALNRHLGHCSAGADARVPSIRVNQSCQACSERKIRCPRGHPCRRCADLGQTCHYLVHGGTRRLRTPSITDRSPLTEPETGDADAGDDSMLPISGLLEQQSASMTFDDQYLFDAVDVNPWLSWAWTEPPWDTLEPVSSIPADASQGCDEQLVDNRSYIADMLDPSPSGHVLDARERFASIVDARIDPVEHHRQSIIIYLQEIPGSVQQNEIMRWLNEAQFPLLLKTYFKRHHRHTPIIHLPTFNIVTSPTLLILALALIAASYTPGLGLRTRTVVLIVKLACRLTIESDQCLRNGGSATLESLQALMLLAIVDRLLVKRIPGSGYSVDMEEVVRLARSARIFSVPNDPQDISWINWTTMESRRRLGLVLFAFDAFLSVLHDETPRVRIDELNMRFPSPESMFMAASEAEWRGLHTLHSQQVTATFSVSLTLSTLFSGLGQPAPLPNTLMGRFVALHGILQHAWRTKRVLLQNFTAMFDPVLEPYVTSKANTIHNSLQAWRSGWPDNLLDFEPSPERPSLYQDRAEACWYLAGIVMLPHVVTASSEKPTADANGALSVQQILERLMVLSDHGQLPSPEPDFNAAYHLVVGQDLANARHGALGALVYREADTTEAAFEA